MGTLSPRGRGQDEGARSLVHEAEAPAPGDGGRIARTPERRNPLTLPSPPWGEGLEGDAASPRDLTTLARNLRHNQTAAERLLWSRLRGRRLGGWKFRRQAPVGPYIADFLCSDAWLIVELDGGHHNRDADVAKDRKRTAELEGRAYLVVRFWNHEVMADLDAVCETILDLVGGAQGHVF